MRWITRARPRTDRIACPWLLRRFIDQEAEIVFAPTEDVLSRASADPDARSFDAPGADYTHRGSAPRPFLSRQVHECRSSVKQTACTTFGPSPLPIPST